MDLFETISLDPLFRKLVIEYHVDSVLKRAQVSEKVFSVYYDLPVGHASAGALEDSIGSAAGSLALSNVASAAARIEQSSQQLMLADR